MSHTNCDCEDRNSSYQFILGLVLGCLAGVVFLYVLKKQDKQKITLAFKTYLNQLKSYFHIKKTSPVKSTVGARFPHPSSLKRVKVAKPTKVSKPVRTSRPPKLPRKKFLVKKK